MFFFFFKQKTAYEMRISDWSSDVCSSDLALHGSQHESGRPGRPRLRLFRQRLVRREQDQQPPRGRADRADRSAAVRRFAGHAQAGRLPPGPEARAAQAAGGVPPTDPRGRKPLARSEEHTSELQSLMRISYAVFCLKKKK